MNPFSSSDPIWRNPPFRHQEEMAGFHYYRYHSMNTSEMGIGKTPAVIVALTRLLQEGKIGRILVVAPNTILENWESEIGRWGAPLSQVIILRGTKKKRLELLASNNTWYIINFEGLRIIMEGLILAHFDVVVADELHHAANASAQQTKALLQISKFAKTRIGLTGTPIRSGLQDLWAIYQFIDPGIFAINRFGFRAKYLYNRNAGHPYRKWPDWVPKENAVEEIRKRTQPVTITYLKKDVLKWLPPLLFEKRVVELKGEQKRVYEELEEEFLVELDGEMIVAQHILPRINKLLQLCGGFAYGAETPAHDGVPAERRVHPTKENAKLDELMELIEGELKGKQVIIWCQFRQEIERILETLKGRGVSIIHGDIKPEARAEAVKLFNAGENRFFIGQPQTGGEGISIYAPYMIFYSRSFKSTDREQAIGRSHRPGAEKFDNITVIDLIAKDTLDDERVMKRLEEKYEMLRAVRDGPLPPIPPDTLQKTFSVQLEDDDIPY